MTESGLKQRKAKAGRVIGYLKVAGAVLGACALTNGAWMFNLESRILKSPTVRDPNRADQVMISLKNTIFFVPEALAQSYQLASYVFWSFAGLAAVFLVIYYRYENPFDKTRY